MSVTTGTFVTTNRSEYGVANADFDEDGDLDLFLPNARSEAASTLYRNDLAGANHWLKVHCTGGASNRSGIGAKVRLVLPSGRTLHEHVTTANGIYSASDRRVHFGLGTEKTITYIEIAWPSGIVQRVERPAVNQVLRVVETAR